MKFFFLLLAATLLLVQGLLQDNEFSCILNIPSLPLFDHEALMNFRIDAIVDSVHVVALH